MINGRYPQPVVEAARQFPEAFQEEIAYAGPLAVAWAPGRVNIIGEHTDYNDGYVLPLAVDRVSAFAGRKRQDKTVRLWSAHFQAYAQFTLEDLPASFEAQRQTLPGWARYVLGVATELTRVGIALSGFDATLTGDVPLGGGMSSSASLEVATAYACLQFADGQHSIGDGGRLTKMEVAALCQRAEQIASGVMCGILDQAASCLGEPGKTALLDCRSLAYHYYPFEDPEVTIVVIDTSVRHDLAETAYNERREQCEEATCLLREAILNAEPENSSASEIKALRDITPEQFERYQYVLSEVLRKRAGYVVAEDARVLRVVEALKQNDFGIVGAILWDGHAGLRDEYEVSCPELDVLVDIAQQVPGVLGGRMMGGGFGGCTVNLVRREAVDALTQAVEQQYFPRTGRHASIDICRAAGGPGMAVWEAE
ncbi:galactokinase [Ktedonospora formicarum]|uniref:Galactokinase n=1 Tax=Ktedonospora formicarum TaxID=2778364 RepID=A0A8J3IDF4_9CHLR|nr:galactokinase [Ktedonospora formicarum]GHO50029.1 galactokinase [Ktedonospora formicarum]